MSSFRAFRIALLIAFAIAGAHPTPVGAAPVDPTALARAIAAARDRVPEFREIREEAARRGLRAFLMGGTAAAFGNHVKQQLLDAQGVAPSSPHRLRDAFSEIFHPEQDFDLVVTGAGGRAETSEEIDAFRAWLHDKFQFQFDGRSRWDVRGLVTQNGYRFPLLDNSDFLNQHNDTLSLGMIELTPPPAGESAVRDLAAMGTHGQTPFLRDLAGDELAYLHSARHFETKFAREGRNPEILSAIRYLIKVGQYGKEIPPEAERQLERIAREFDPKAIQGYAGTWIEHKARRLITQSVDPERSRALLEKLGLYGKLRELGETRSVTPGSLHWWLSRQALLDGETPGVLQAAAHGKTASDLGITHVAHQTNPLAHRMISWRYDDRPIVFISRSGAEGESAFSGNGFYTLGGRAGDGGNTGQDARHVVFRVEADALEGRDFIQSTYNAKPMLIWRNQSKLKLEREETPYPPSLSCAMLFTKFATSLSIAKPPSLLASRIRRHLPDVLMLGTAALGTPVIGAGLLRKYEDFRHEWAVDRLNRQFPQPKPAEAEGAAETPEKARESLLATGQGAWTGECLSSVRKAGVSRSDDRMVLEGCRGFQTKLQWQALSFWLRSQKNVSGDIGRALEALATYTAKPQAACLESLAIAHATVAGDRLELCRGFTTEAGIEALDVAAPALRFLAPDELKLLAAIARKPQIDCLRSELATENLDDLTSQEKIQSCLAK